MKIIQAENNLGSKFSQSGVSIKTATTNFLPLGSYLKVDGHYFSITSSITSPIEDVPASAQYATLVITATETGYHGSRFKSDFDPRLLLGKKVVPVTDPNEIAEVRKESTYC